MIETRSQGESWLQLPWGFMTQESREPEMFCQLHCHVRWITGVKIWSWGKHPEKMQQMYPYCSSNWMRPLSLNGPVNISQRHAAVNGTPGCCGISHAVAPKGEGVRGQWGQGQLCHQWSGRYLELVMQWGIFWQHLCGPEEEHSQGLTVNVNRAWIQSRTHQSGSLSPVQQSSGTTITGGGNNNRGREPRVGLVPPHVVRRYQNSSVSSNYFLHSLPPSTEDFWTYAMIYKIILHVDKKWLLVFIEYVMACPILC